MVSAGLVIDLTVQVAGHSWIWQLVMPDRVATTFSCFTYFSQRHLLMQLRKFVTDNPHEQIRLFFVHNTLKLQLFLSLPILNRNDLKPL